MNAVAVRRALEGSWAPIIFYKLGMFMGRHRQNQGGGLGPPPFTINWVCSWAAIS